MRPAVVWIGIVVGLLAMELVFHGVLVFKALDDPSFAVEADYEQKAANWDEIQRIEARSAELGWDVVLSTLPGTEAGTVEVTVTLHDAAGQPVEDARVGFEAFHNARAAQIHRGRLAEAELGTYRETLPFRRSGVWEFRLDVTRGDERWVGKFRKQVLSVPRSVGNSG